MAATEYHIFWQSEDGKWRLISTRSAVSADAAIRAQAASDEDDGTFAAVPARSWKPRTVKVEKRASFAKEQS